MKTEEIIRVIGHMQQNAQEESDFIKMKGLDPKKDSHGFEQYQQGWDDALKEILERIK